MIEKLESLAAGQPDDSPVWREISYLTRHSEAGRLRYNCFRYRGVPLGSGAIESTIRRSDQPPAEGDEHLLEGSQRGSGLSTSGCRSFRSMGRDPKSHAGGNGEGPENRVALGATGMPGRVESARRRG